MTKTLTEQWREGTLKRGYYYYLTKVGAKVIGYQCFGLKFPYDYYHNTIDSVEEVLASVPTYDQFVELTEKVKKLESRLKDSEEALKDFCDDCTLPKCCGCDEDCAGWKAKEYFERYGVK